MTAKGRSVDSDEKVVLRTSRTVGVQIAAASAALVVAVLVALIVYVLSEVRITSLLQPNADRPSLDIGVGDLIAAGVIVGMIAVALAGTVGWFATRRAVKPLAEALRLQREFVADASHELRTPLTILDARLQVLQRSLSSEDASAPQVDALRKDTKTLVLIVEDLLNAAELGGRRSDGSEAVDAIPAVRSAVASFDLLVRERGITLEVETEPHAVTELPAVAVRRCVAALVDNAVVHSPDGGTVRIEALRRGRALVVSVQDQGAGVRGVDPARIFDRFAHSTESDQPDRRTGFGIGLALVRDIVTRFGGTVRVVETGPTGTTIAFSVPRREGPAQS